MRLNNNTNTGPLVSRYTLLLQMPPRASAATARVEEEDEWSESECSCEVSVKGTNSSSSCSITEDGKQSSRRVRFASEESMIVYHETDVVYSAEEHAACWYSKAWRSENKRLYSETTDELRAVAEEEVHPMSDDDDDELTKPSLVHALTSLYQSCQRGELVPEWPAGVSLSDETWGMERSILPVYHRDKMARRCALVESMNELQDELQLLPPEDILEALACAAREYSRPAILFARHWARLVEEQA